MTSNDESTLGLDFRFYGIDKIVELILRRSYSGGHLRRSYLLGHLKIEE